MIAKTHNGITSRLVPYLRACYGLDTRSMALFRIAIAIVFLVDFVLRFQHLTAFYADAGAFPRRLAMAAISNDRWSVLFLNGNSGFAAIILLIGIVSALMLLVGYRTRWATVVLWIVVVSFQARNNHILSGADTLMRMSVFWAMFLPLGAKWSLDARLRSESMAEGENASWFGSVATFGLIIQTACLYFFTAWQKSGARWHEDANATYYALGARDLSNSFGDWLFHNAPEFFFTASTRGTIFLEFAIPLFLLLPVRTGWLRGLAVLGIILLQLGIATTMTVGLFPYISIAGGLAILPAGFWRFVEARFPARSQFNAIRERLDRRVASVFPAARPLESTQVELEAGRRLLPGRAVVFNIIAAISIVLVLMWNATTISDFENPGPVRSIAVAAGLFQNWSMFAPNPQGQTTWYIVEGSLASGQEIDVLVPIMEGDLSLREEVVWDQSDSLVIKDKYWRKYFQQIRDRENDLLAFSGYVCRSWNGEYSGEERLDRIVITRGSAQTLPNSQRSEPEFTPVGSWTCN